MTPTEKDAMALAVLDNAAVDTEHTLGCPNLAGRLREARAHLASRIAELEAELAAVLKAADYFARNFNGKNSDKLRAAIKAARGGE